MGQWWKYALRLIAIIAASAPAVMSVLGSLDSFTEPVIRHVAAGVGLCFDVYLLASHSAFGHLRQKRREWAYRLGLAIWLACALWTGLSSAAWLESQLKAAQAPVEQQKETKAKTESERQADLASERETLKQEEETSRAGKTKEIRDNARQLAAETRARIDGLKAQNTFKAKTETTEPAPIKSPFSGYEKLVTFLLLAFSQGCWFMALDEETAEASGAEMGKPEAETAPLPGKRQRKQGGNGKRKSAGTPANANVIKFRKRPTKEEIIAFVDRNLADGNDKWNGAEAHFGYCVRHLRNFLNEKAAA
jgi:hypothetical protein